MRKKKDKSISLKFLIFISLSITGIIIYATYPNTLEKIRKGITYEEQLEITNRLRSTNNLSSRKEVISKRNEEEISQNTNNTIITKRTNRIIRTTSNYKDDNNFKLLLDELKKYPSNSVSSAQILTERILKYLGYNGYEVKIKTNNITEEGVKPIGTTIAAHFDIPTGTIYINQSLISKLNIKELTAIIAHELDHFDKIAKLCKFMGPENFFNFTNENNLEIKNKNFWIDASKKADITNFNGALYQKALQRFINQNKLEITSLYADLYLLTETLRNPLEISAYELSDYILDYYNIKNKESLTKKLANQFNNVDWAIYNITSKDNKLIKERIAIFDYILMQAIIEKNSKYIATINKCTNENGNLTPFWKEFKNDNNDFFDKNIPAKAETYNYIIDLLKRVENIAKNDISVYNKADAIKLYVYTLIANSKYKNSNTYIKNSGEDFISLIKENDLDYSKDLLKMYIILLCTENNLNNNSDKELPSLYYIKIPKFLEDINNSDKKSQRFNFIYKNPEFISKFNEQKTINPNITEQKLLKEMIENTASEIK